jgi:rhodanese-related sulfurtransferase
MPQKIIKTSSALVKEALAEVPAISVNEAMSLVALGMIPGAVASSRGLMEFHIDPDSPAHNPAFNQDKTYIFYCASGGRSALAAKVAMDMGLSPVVNLTGGIAAWAAAGGAVE